MKPSKYLARKHRKVIFEFSSAFEQLQLLHHFIIEFFCRKAIVIFDKTGAVLLINKFALFVAEFYEAIGEK